MKSFLGRSESDKLGILLSLFHYYTHILIPIKEILTDSILDY